MNVLIFLVIVGVLMALLPMDARVKQLIYIVVVIVFIIWLLNVFGITLSNLKIG